MVTGSGRQEWFLSQSSQILVICSESEIRNSFSIHLSFLFCVAPSRHPGIMGDTDEEVVEAASRSSPPTFHFQGVHL